jgi:hypothetical protein
LMPFLTVWANSNLFPLSNAYSTPF